METAMIQAPEFERPQTTDPREVKLKEIIERLSFEFLVWGGDPTLSEVFRIAACKSFIEDGEFDGDEVPPRRKRFSVLPHRVLLTDDEVHDALLQLLRASSSIK